MGSVIFGWASAIYSLACSELIRSAKQGYKLPVLHTSRKDNHLSYQQVARDYSRYEIVQKVKLPLQTFRFMSRQ